MKKILVIAALALGASCARAEPYRFPTYHGAAEVKAACDHMIDAFKGIEARLDEMPAADAASLLDTMDGMNRTYENIAGPMGLLAAVDPDKAVRDAGDDCELRGQEFNSAFQQNAHVYALLKKAQPADSIDREYLRDLLDAFEDAGIALPADRQARARDLNNEITKLSQEFSRRVREDDTTVAFTKAELRGVPEDVLKGAKRDAQGRYVLGMSYPVSFPVIDHAVNPMTRERMWRAFYERGGKANLGTLDRIVALRREYANLFGFDSYADFALRRRMAGSEAAVQSFLGKVEHAVSQRELSDLALLRKTKAQDLHQPLAKTVVYRWDVGYYVEMARRQRFHLDEEQFRQYFPPEASLEFVFDVARHLFGVEFEPVKETLWHPDARAFQVVDAASKEPLGTLFVDLFPRPGKYSHAAQWSFRNVSTLTGRKPAAGLVVNFNRRGLTLEELQTLLHEFGHAMHTLLSKTRYSSEGGTSVKLDFVEAPSQMLEDWVYDPKVLALFQKVCPTCKPVPKALVQRADQARHFMKGIMVSRQHLYASYDLALYGKMPEESMALWKHMESATPLGYVEGTKFPAAFDHIAGGYAAGYYAYLWSLVIAEDLRTAFAGRKLSPLVGHRYRVTVLSQGGQEPPAELLRNFLGRPTNSQAFFTWLDK